MAVNYMLESELNFNYTLLYGYMYMYFVSLQCYVLVDGNDLKKVNCNPNTMLTLAIQSVLCKTHYSILVTSTSSIDDVTCDIT